jgi:hypothetical protein
LRHGNFLDFTTAGEVFDGEHHQEEKKEDAKAQTQEASRKATT